MLAIPDRTNLEITPPFRLTETGLEVVGEPSLEQWKECGTRLAAAKRCILWAVGDWLRYGEERQWGEMYTQAVKGTGLRPQTLRIAKHVAGRFDLFRRLNKLSFEDHLQAASLPSAEADAILARAASESLSTRQVRELVRQAKQKPAVVSPDDPCCTAADLAALVAAGRRFGCIYADPPWHYGNQATRAATDNHYPTMTVDEISALPVADLAADECHLHLWTTNAFLEPALVLLRGWGFEFKSTFVWVKPQLGIGNYWRCSHEIMLLGVRGGLTFEANGIKSWLLADRTEHSAKPEAVRELVEKMSPGPRLELFARRVPPGWTVWGNEIRRSLIDPPTVCVG